MTKTKLQTLVSELRAIADSIQTLANDEPSQGQPESAPEVKLEQVRSVLADKSRSGKTAEVRSLLEKFGATKLSEIEPVKYPDLLKEAEVL